MVGASATADIPPSKTAGGETVNGEVRMIRVVFRQAACQHAAVAGERMRPA